MTDPTPTPSFHPHSGLAHETLAAFLAVLDSIHRATCASEIVQAAAHAAVTLPGISAAWVVLDDPERGVWVAAAEGLPPALRHPDAFDGDCECRRRLTSGDLACAINLIDCERLKKALGDRQGLNAHASIPLLGGTRMLGILNLAGPDLLRFSTDDLRVFQAIGSQVGFALERCELRQRSEARARMGEEKCRRLMEYANDGIWVIDPDGRVEEANYQAARIVGRERAALLGTVGLDLLAPDNRKAGAALLARLFTTGAVDAADLRIQRPDGTIRRVDVTGSVVDFEGRTMAILIAHDTTERREAESARYAAAETLSALFHASPIAIIAATPEARVTQWNPAAERLFGWTAEETCGRPIPILPEDRREESARLRARVLSGEILRDESLVRLGKDGASIRVRMSAAPVRDAEGKVVGLIALFVDESERRQLEDQLRQAQKMEAVGRLAGGVAHDFNNLLTVISGYTQILRAPSQANPATDAKLEVIEQAAERAAGLTRQLLAFSRRQVLETRTIDLNVVIADIAKMVRRLIGEDIVLETRPTAGLDSVLADPGQMEQVLMNLVVNGRDAMPNGGRLTVVAENAHLDEGFVRSHPGARVGDYVVMTVSDTGCGMDATTLGHLFEPFFTTKEVGKGTGLGLATVYGIVKQSNGTIDVQSAPGRGTTFRIYLPRHVAASPADTVARPATRVAGGSESILVVEDDPGLRKLACNILADLGYAVAEAAHGEEAWKLCRARSRPFDLVLSDVVMPGLGGRELAARLAHERPGTRILFMTGYPEFPATREGPGALEGPVLMKPFLPTALANKVREVLDGPPAPRPNP